MFKMKLPWLDRAITAIALIAAVWALIVAKDTLDIVIEQRDIAAQIGAWNIIATSPQARGNIGQKEAVEFQFGRGEDLRSINLRQAHLVGVALQGADLTNAGLEGAILEGAQLAGAVLLGARLRQADLGGADLTSAVLQCAYLSPGPAGDASGVSFTEGADLSGAVLVDTKLDGADLTDATFTGADISDASFRAFACDGDTARETEVTPEQLGAACADPARPPALPERPAFAGFQAPACSP